jgi:hypothetical protein
MNESINEKVKVFAEFGRDITDIVPSQFNWGEKEFRVKNARKAIYRNGGNVSYLFSGNDGDTKFELDFNPKDLSWVLTKMWNTATA